MEKTEQWWGQMFKMYAQLVENFNDETFLEFKKELYSIPYTYAKPREGLGIGARYVRDITEWNVFVYEISLKQKDYNEAMKYLDRALDYFCDPTLDFDEKIIKEAKECMQDLTANCMIGIYEGCHDIYNI